MSKFLKALSLTALVGIFMLSGSCAQIIGILNRTPEPEPTPTPQPQYVVGKGTVAVSPDTDELGRTIITYMVYADDTGALSAIVNDYNSVSTDYSVVLKEVSGSAEVDYTQLGSAFLAEADDFDIIDIDAGWNAEFAALGYTVPLDDYATRSGIDFTDYLPKALVPCIYERKLYAMPRTVSLSTLFFRNDMMGSAPYTWEETLNVAENRMGSAGTSNGLIFGAKDSYDFVRMAQELIKGYGGSVFDESGNLVMSGTGTTNALAQLKAIYASPAVPQNSNHYSTDDVGKQFFSGESVFMWNTSREWVRGNDGINPNIVRDFSIAPLPRESGNPDILWCTAMAINANSPHKDGAWDFIQFVVSEESQQSLAVYGGFIPVLPAVLDAEEAVSSNAYFASNNFKQALLNANAEPVNVNYGNIVRILDERLYSYLAGSANMTSTISGIRSDAKRLLPEN